MHKIKIIVIGITIALLAFACGNQSEKPNSEPAADSEIAKTETPAPEAKDDVSEGKRHYIANCASCHKEDGTGGKVEIEGKTINPDNLTTEKMIKMSDAEYVEYVRDGIPDEGMPAFKDILNDEQQKQVVKYIRKELQKQ